MHSITIMTDGSTNFRKFLVEGTKPNLKKVKTDVERSLMLVTALAPVIGYDKASQIAHYAMDNDLTLKEAALKLGFVSEAEFDRVVDPAKMVTPYAGAGALLRRWLATLGSNPFAQPFGAALLAGVIGAIVTRLQISSVTQLVAVCPCMVLVPGPHFLNGAIDLARTRVALGACRIGYASLITLVISVGLLAGLHSAASSCRLRHRPRPSRSAMT
jgi:hypothetical protein